MILSSKVGDSLKNLIVTLPAHQSNQVEIVQSREKLREREREQAEQIEREILNKKLNKKKTSGSDKVEFPTLTKFGKRKSSTVTTTPSTNNTVGRF